MAADLTFDDPVAAASDALAEMRAEVAENGDGLDHAVVLSHLGAGDDDLARELDVDVILGGHIHSPRNECVADTLLVRPGVNGETVVEVDLGGAGTPGRGTAADAVPTATLHEPDGVEPIAGLEAALEERMAAADLDEVVDRVDEPIERTGEVVVHGGECRVGNFAADAFCWALDADVGLSNAGGLRQGDPWVGDVTKADLISLIPFEEPVALASVTGAELRDVLREMAAPDVDFGKDDWWHGHVSNARVVWDADGERLLEATVVGGEPIDPEAHYTVAVSEYLLHSDHEFPTLAQRHTGSTRPTSSTRCSQITPVNTGSTPDRRPDRDPESRRDNRREPVSEVSRSRAVREQNPLTRYRRRTAQHPRRTSSRSRASRARVPGGTRRSPRIPLSRRPPKISSTETTVS